MTITKTAVAGRLPMLPSLAAGLALLTFGSLPVRAQQPTLGSVLKNSGVAVSGYVDASYSWLSESGVFTSGTPARVFDDQTNAFTLHQAALTAGYQPDKGWGGLVNLTAGEDAKVIKSLGSSTDNFDVTQAYVQYAGAHTTFMAGKFATLAGAELIDPTGDSTYSRSILFGYAIPFTHTGVRATFKASDAVSFVVGLNNGWDQMQDANAQKTLELAFDYTPGSHFSLFANGYSGDEPSSFGNDRRSLLDLVANITANDKLSFTVNVDVGRQAGYASLVNGNNITAKWSGVAGYLNYKLSSKWGLVVRAEYLDDKDGFRTGVIQKWKEGTVALRYMPAGPAEIRFELRDDKSNNPTFVSKDGLSVGDGMKSAGIEFLYKF